MLAVYALGLARLSTALPQPLNPLPYCQDDEDAENLEDALFENQLDPISLLENMGRQATWSDEAIGYQPYQILTNTAKQARAHHAAAPSTRSKEQIDDDASDQVCFLGMFFHRIRSSEPCSH